MEEQELVPGIVLRFDSSWMVERFLLRRGDLLEGEAGSKLLGRVAELRRTSDLTELETHRVIMDMIR